MNGNFTKFCDNLGMPWTEKLRIVNGIDTNLLEEWTRLKCSHVIFNSDIDNWSKDTSVLNDRIIGKKQIAIIIEDEDGEIFGYYCNPKIIDYYYKSLRLEQAKTDPKSFEFNLESNGRLDKPMKFEIKDIEHGYYMYEYSSNK